MTVVTVTGRNEAWWIRVRCTNTECSDNGVDRVIALPHLGDGVFLSPTTSSPLFVDCLNLICGTCRQRIFVEVST